MNDVAATPPLYLFAVRNQRGGPWDWSRPMREQEAWKEHAAFMNALVDDGFVLLGGPLEGDRDVLLIVTAGSEAAVRDRLAEDPWQRAGMLTTTAIEGWTILLSPEILDTVLLPMAGAAGATGRAPMPETVST
ncbi:MAG: YciI family protein [Candidatus Dormiibacterota bacterium]|jgi:uncharacterized protein YciI